MPSSTDDHIQKLTKASGGLLSETDAEKCAAIIHRDRQEWQSKLLSLPKKGKILFIEETGLHQKMIVMPSIKEKKQIDIFILLEKLPLASPKERKTILHVLHADRALPLTLHLLPIRKQPSATSDLHEAKMLKQWSQTPNIIKTFRLFPFEKENKNYVLALQKYYPLGSLEYYTRQHTLSTKDQFSILETLLHALQTLHQKGWIHHKIEASSVLLSRPKQNQPIQGVLSGLKKMIPPKIKDWDSYIHKPKKNYPPEWIHFIYTGRGTEYLTPSMDLWQLGLMLSQSFFNHAPKWGRYTNPLDLYRAQRTPSSFPEPKEKESIEHLLWEMMSPIPTERITVEKALKRLQVIKKKTTSS